MNDVFADVPSFTSSRLSSLFSDFSRLKDINPEGYDANVSAWEDLLLKCLQKHTFHSRISLPASNLTSTLASPQYGEPKSLDLVLRALIEKHSLVPWSIYKDSFTMISSYTDFLSPRKVWSKLWSSINTSLYSPAIGESSDEYYLHWPTLLNQAAKILESLEESVESQGCYSARVLNFRMFYNFSKRINQNLSDVDIEAVLTFLSRDTRRLGIQMIPGSDKSLSTCLIKVGRDKRISSQDFEILDIKVNISSLGSRVATLEEVIDEHIPKRLQHLLNSKAPEFRLRNLLIRKSQLTRSLDQASTVFNKLSLILNKIDEAQSNGVFFESLRSAQTVISNLNKQVSFADLENLDAKLDSQVAFTDEISDAIGASSHWNDEEISEELELLEKEHGIGQSPELQEKPEDDRNSSGNKAPLVQNIPAITVPTIEDALSTGIQNLMIDSSSKETLQLRDDDKSSSVRTKEKTPALV